jgi:hypothetical protein
LADANCFTSALPFVYDSPGEARDILRQISNGDSHTVAEVSRGNQFNSKDRADQDRYLAGEFARTNKWTSDFETRLQKDRTDKSEWDNERARDLNDRVRNAELAVEKIGAANVLAVEKIGATNLIALKDCCCEIKEMVMAEGTRTRELVSQIDRERLQARLAVLEARTGV